MMIIDRRHSVSESTAIKAPCRAATVAGIALAGEQTVDGVALVAADRVLVKDQADGTRNGVYEVSTGNWSRARDFDGAFDIVQGTLVRVTGGASNAGYWEVTSANPIAVETTPIAFAMTTTALAGVSALVQSLLDDTTAAAFFATLGTVAEPIGTVKQYAGSTEPGGYLFCRGQAISRTAYAALFGVIGTSYGAGDGSNTFNLPDIRGRVIAGKDNMGGTSANRLTAQTGGLDGDVLGAAGGSETHTLTTAQLPSHTHTFTGQALPTHTHTTPVPDGVRSGDSGGFESLVQGTTATVSSAVSAGTPAGTNSNTGEGGAHNNVQPTFILNHIIYAGIV